MNSSVRLLLLLPVAVCMISSASAITITSNNVVANLSFHSIAPYTGTSIPGSVLLDNTFGGGYSRTQIDYLGSGNQATLSNTFTQSRLGNQGLFAEAYQSLYFTADANTTYSLSGSYQATDLTTAGGLYYWTYLYDFSGGGYLAYSSQQSESTLNESFVLGGAGGDSDNYFAGSLSGNLIAGHSYQWYYDVYTHAYPDSDGGASATGNITLKIGGGAPAPDASVPDTGSPLAMLGLALAGIAGLRRKFGA